MSHDYPDSKAATGHVLTSVGGEVAGEVEAGQRLLEELAHQVQGLLQAAQL